MIPTSDLTALILQRGDNTDPSYDQEYPYNDNFEVMGYSSVNFIDTLAPMFYYQFGSLLLTGFMVLAKWAFPQTESKVETFKGTELEGGEEE